MTSRQKWCLYVLVFIGGAVLMVLEIAGGRLLAPFFGSDIFVWGSIIGVFMVALALGYYIGGRAADRLPRLAALTSIEMLAGVLLLILPAAGPALCNAVSTSDLGPRSGPLLAALALFTLPSVLLGVGSPFAVRLAAKTLEAMGHVAGTLFAISTAGSILGTFLAAFVLIPNAGTRAIIFCAGVVEFVTALAVFAVAAKSSRSALKATVGMLFIALVAGLASYPRGPGVPLDMPWEQHKCVLLLLEDAQMSARLEKMYAAAGHTVSAHSTAAAALGALSSSRVNLLVTSDSASHRDDFIRRLGAVRTLPVPVLVLCAEQMPAEGWAGYKGRCEFVAAGASARELMAASRRLLGQNELVYCEETPYHLIIVSEQEHPDLEGRMRRRRVLRFNNRIQSAVYVDELDSSGRPRKYESAVTYTAMLHLGLVFYPQARRALLVGLGGGIAASEFRAHYGMDVEAVDIDAAVKRVAQEYFFLTPGERLRIHIADGRRFLETTDQRYDIIVLDAYSSAGRIPFQLVTREFFALVRSRLSERGVVVSNVISAISGAKSQVFKSVYRTQYAAGFENVYVFPRFPLSVEKEYRSLYRDDYSAEGWGMNIILVASQDQQRLSRAEVLASARTLTRRTEWKPVVLPYFEEYASFLYDLKHTRRQDVIQEMDDGVVFTDDFAPSDMMFAGL